MVRVWTRRGLATRGMDLTAVRRSGVNLLAIVAVRCSNDRASFVWWFDQELDGWAEVEVVWM